MPTAAAKIWLGLMEGLYIFLGTHCSDKKLETNTTDKYRRTAKRLAIYMEHRLGSSALRMLSEDVIRGYLMHFQNACNPDLCPILDRGKFHSKKEISHNTYDAELTTLKVLCTWLFEGDYVSGDFAKKIQPYGEANKVYKTHIITPEELNKVLPIAMEFTPIMGYELKFIWHSGVRISSARSMTIGDYCPENISELNPLGTYSYINEKVKNQRMTKPIDPEMVVWMKEYLAWYKAECVKFGWLTEWQEIPSYWILFPTWSNYGAKTRGAVLAKKIIPMGMKRNPSQCISEIFRKAGIHILGNASHAIRRGAGTEIYIIAGLEAARIFLDHQDQKTTLKYLMIDALKKVEQEAIFARFSGKPKQGDTEEPDNVVVQFDRRRKTRVRS